ncbi:50S ribosomal protein L5 [Rhodoferax sp. 4810]|uniref:Large ribosomal subunit protein uL5 n=1 Tax=Thiospirillum jenense TaxID=1653858 RepID=A0A839HEW0_9GAMM|nr:50S ribosomal protein L5 [Thiospirillum jenense]MBB1073014.1 50S ribosomal protein L5 [Rhodoferax jenense]MBB1124962.1 50S ribosomal protein L5 [Thiospirillum jenense]
MARLQKLYQEKLITDLRTRFNYASVMQVPRLVKITLNMGVGEAVADKKVMDFAVADLTKISGQKPVVTKARKSVAGFKIREGWPVGCMVTLRRERMYEFLDRLIHIAIPRIRDFRGMSPRAFDGRGNYSLGVREQIIFPEIDYDKIDMLRGLDIVITTSAKTDEEGRALLDAFQFPFRS